MTRRTFIASLIRAADGHVMETATQEAIRGGTSTPDLDADRAGRGSYALSTESRSMSRSDSGRVEDGPSGVLFDGTDDPSSKLGSDCNDRHV